MVKKPSLHRPPTEPRYVMESDGEEQAPKRPSAWSEVLSIVGVFGTALLVAVLIIAFVFRSYQVDGPSMRDTLENNDKLIIWKVPRTWSMITGHAYIPQRGDIIVFTETGLSTYGQQDSKQLIKRVVGLPGDHIIISDGHYTIFNKEHPRGFNPDSLWHNAHVITPTTGSIDYTLQKDQIFVSGDNRPDSLDSRAFGPINPKQVVGKLVLRVFPPGGARAF